jgi:hypothetical protein
LWTSRAIDSSLVRGSVVLTWFYRSVTVGQVLRASGAFRDDPRTTVFAGAPTTGVDDRGASTKSERKSGIDVRGGDVERIESRRAAVTSTTVHSRDDGVNVQQRQNNRVRSSLFIGCIVRSIVNL